MKKAQLITVLAISALLTTLSIAHGEEFNDYSGKYQVSECKGDESLLKAGRIQVLRGTATQNEIEDGDEIVINRAKGESVLVNLNGDRHSNDNLYYSNTELTRVGDDESYSAEVNDRGFKVIEVRHSFLKQNREVMIIKKARLSIFGEMVFIRKSQKRILGHWATKAKATCRLVRPIIDMSDFAR